MATITDKVRISHHVKAGSLAAALALLAAAGSAFAPTAASVAVPALAFVGLAACAGFAWRRAEAAMRLSEQAAAQCAHLADRLVSLERQLQAPAAGPALRSTVAEVTGTVGLLGGVVRELARNVAAQHRDVADLKDSLRLPPRTREALKDERPPLKIMPEPRRIRELPEPLCSAPEPTLLPSARKSTDEELRRMRLIAQALEADGIELHLQPIVALPQCKVRFYEAFARLRLINGTLLDPSEFLPLIEQLGLAPDFDRRILERAMAVARHLVARGSEAIVGVNLSACSVDEPGFLRSLAGLLEASPEILGRIVLELPQASWRRLDAGQRAALAALRDRGVPLSLHRACDVAFDARALAEARALADLGLRFMKLPADAMVAAAGREDALTGPGIGVRDFASALHREGIRLVAERVECEEAVPALIGLGVPLAQGFVFAAPRAVRAEVFEQGAAAPDEETSFDPSLLRCAG